MSEPSSRLARLRAGTSDAHTRIETVPVLSRLVQDDLTQDEYVSVLQHMHGFHTGFEAALSLGLAHWPQALALLDGARLTALASDLAWFGAAPRPLPGPLPVLSDLMEALGALYVLEGSALGGRVIARHVERSLGVRPGAGGSFYGGQTAEAARTRWQILCDLLERAAPQDGPQDAPQDGPPSTRNSPDDRLINSAIDTFRFLERWMRHISVVPGRHRSRAATVAA